MHKKFEINRTSGFLWINFLNVGLFDTGPGRRNMTVRADVRHRTSRRTAPYDTSYGDVRRLVRYHPMPRTVPYGGSYVVVRRLVRRCTTPRRFRCGDTYGTVRWCTVRRLVGWCTAARTVSYDDVSYMYHTSRRTMLLLLQPRSPLERAVMSPLFIIIMLGTPCRFRSFNLHMHTNSPGPIALPWQ